MDPAVRDMCKDCVSRYNMGELIPELTRPLVVVELQPVSSYHGSP